jgi:hypothetical protein
MKKIVGIHMYKQVWNMSSNSINLSQISYMTNNHYQSHAVCLNFQKSKQLKNKINHHKNQSYSSSVMRCQKVSYFYNPIQFEIIRDSENKL